VAIGVGFTGRGMAITPCGTHRMRGGARTEATRRGREGVPPACNDSVGNGFPLHDGYPRDAPGETGTC
jgi:hypothetical protein